MPGTTVDRQCGSSQQAISFAAQGVISGAYDIVIAAGVESMGRVPMGSSVLPGSDPFGAMAQRYPDGLVPQGISAELIAAKWGFSRQQLDEFSAGSHEAARQPEGRFDNELTPIAGLATDEIIRPGTTVETLAGLKPAFYNPPTRRFPRSSGRSPRATRHRCRMAVPRCSSRPPRWPSGSACDRWPASTATVVGSDPLYMLTGVIPATEKVLQRAGLTLADIDLFEVNEAFAPVVLSWAQDTGADLAKTNVNGGAIAIGHPARRQRRADHDHDGQRVGAARPLRAADDVRSGWHGQRHHHRAALGKPVRRGSARTAG